MGVDAPFFGIRYTTYECNTKKWASYPSPYIFGLAVLSSFQSSFPGMRPFIPRRCTKEFKCQVSWFPEAYIPPEHVSPRIGDLHWVITPMQDFRVTKTNMIVGIQKASSTSANCRTSNAKHCAPSAKPNTSSWNIGHFGYASVGFALGK